MDLKSITTIVNSNNSEEVKRYLIINVLAMDENVIPEILEILARERKVKDELITDFNLELSRAHIYIDERPESKLEAKQNFNKTFITDAIGKFYYKYKKQVNHLYNRFL